MQCSNCGAPGHMEWECTMPDMAEADSWWQQTMFEDEECAPATEPVPPQGGWKVRSALAWCEPCEAPMKLVHDFRGPSAVCMECYDYERL
jgi:hypothetical protein